MAVNLTLKEPERRGYRPPKPFGLYADGLAAHEIVRLLLGSVNVREVTTGRLTALNTNEFRQKAQRMCRPDRISHFLFENEIGLPEYEAFVRLLSSKNQDFFERLRQELTLSLVAKRESRYTEAFLYLYRILEMMAVAFPLLYASTQSDFRRSHDFLKSLMLNDRDGDLKVLDRAVPVIAQQGNLSSVTFDFSVSGFDVGWVAAFKSQIEKCQIHRTPNFEFESDSDVLFRVPFNSMPGLLVQFRNRMFHYRAGEANFDLGAIGGSEPVCKIVVREAAHWFALIYVELLRVMARRQF
ncbi:MAG: hypothetical protein KKC29_13760 [Alphaproteobacteria bacterium]|nr:hypothetical protein [Alphaproteobacteria bacterium]MBU2040885.1 hypothetical protein [Alphaproteobacteria bacterium]MBU2125963.1 hypothetical protein [Alphaproteobacteria bacterium]MBU2209125.1 hypothetical protein [Alphaproteobacteria bacterium]MBU2292155.1 hypothetical protein [Alphaproteobacteria bacterium]